MKNSWQSTQKKPAEVIIWNDWSDFNVLHSAFKVDESNPAIACYLINLSMAYPWNIFQYCVGKIWIVIFTSLKDSMEVRIWTQKHHQNKNLKSFNKESADDGASQDLFIDKSYIEKHILFQVTSESFFSRHHSIYVVVIVNS